MYYWFNASHYAVLCLPIILCEYTILLCIFVNCNIIHVLNISNLNGLKQHFIPRIANSSYIGFKKVEFMFCQIFLVQIPGYLWTNGKLRLMQRALPKASFGLENVSNISVKSILMGYEYIKLNIFESSLSTSLTRTIQILDYLSIFCA